MTKQAERLPKECGWFVARLEEVVLAYVWPRLDFQVTKGLNHLMVVLLRLDDPAVRAPGDGAAAYVGSNSTI